MSDNAIGWPTIVAATVALYGAVLSTINLLIARKERRRQVKVTFSQGLTALPGAPVLYHLSMEAANTGTRPVTLSAPFIRLPSGHSVFFPQWWFGSSEFPCNLADGQKCTANVELGWLIDAFQQQRLTGKVALVAVFKDAAGNEYLSKPLSIGSDVVLKAYGQVD